MTSQNQIADQVTLRENKLTLVERLADDLAHEIKNPLHSMVINLEVLRRRLARLQDASADELLRYTGVLNSELERVNRRVDLLLRMVRPARDSDELTTLAEVLEELRELVELECERHHVTLHMDLPVTVVRARLPRSATRQMILSLLLKTLDGLPAGGTLHVASETTPEAMRLYFRARSSPGSTPPAPPGDEDGSYLSVARALAERLGGRLEASEALDGDRSAENGSVRYILDLPRGS